MSLDITQCHERTVPKLSQRSLTRRALRGMHIADLIKKVIRFSTHRVNGPSSEIGAARAAPFVSLTGASGLSECTASSNRQGNQYHQAESERATK